jgi:restriction endonuclease S subunit
LENLEEIDKLLDNYDHPKLNQKDINQISRSTTQNEIQAAIVSQKRKVQYLTDSLLNSIRPRNKN